MLARKIQWLARISGPSAHDRADTEQELWLAVFRQAARYDPARASLETFLGYVASRTAALLRRHKRRKCRGNGVVPLSLERDGTVTGERLTPLSETVSSADVGRRRGALGLDPIAQLEQTEAIADALARMPKRLRTVCQRLMVGTVASAAREMGMSRYEVHQALAEARPYFERAGLGNA